MFEQYNIKRRIKTLPLFFQACVKKLSQIKHKTGNMKENTKILAVLTEEGDLISVEEIKRTKQEIGMFEDDTAIFELLLSNLGYSSSIQWQEIKRINFRL